MCYGRAGHAFRGSTAAAPLKPSCPGRARIRGPTFPRLNSRGPIEAAYFPCDLSRGGSSFRGSTAAAPLKPGQALQKPLLVHDFPRLNSRGPIEAPTRWTRIVQSTRAFRGSTAAAPLKHVLRHRRRTGHITFRGSTAAAPLKLQEPSSRASVAYTFRGSTAAAPLKPLGVLDHLHGGSGFPRLNSRGPIEAVMQPVALVVIGVLSAAQQPRPH